MQMKLQTRVLLAGVLAFAGASIAEGNSAGVCRSRVSTLALGVAEPAFSRGGSPMTPRIESMRSGAEAERLIGLSSSPCCIEGCADAPAIDADFRILLFHWG